MMVLLGENQKNKDALKIVEDVKKDVCRYFDQYKKLWRDEEELYYGVVWKNITEFRPFENNIFDIIETQVPILSDNLPSPSVTVKDHRRKDHAKLLERRIQKVNSDQDWAIKYPEVIRNSLITGTGWVHPYFDHDAKNGQGDMVYELLDYDQVKVSGLTKDIRTADKARVELYRTKDWLIQKYPAFEKQISKLSGESKIEDDEQEGFERHDTGGHYARRFVPKRYKDKDTLKLVITYKKDSSLENIPREETAQQISETIEAIKLGQTARASKWQDHKVFILALGELRKELLLSMGLDLSANFEQAAQVVEQLSEENQEAAPQFESFLLSLRLCEDSIEEHTILQKLNPKGGRPKYPGGYRVIETVDQVVLYDGENKSKHGRISVVPFYCYRNKSVYGHGEIRNIADSQRMQAVMGYAEFKGLQKVSNPEKEVNKESGLTKDDISNEPGAIYEVSEGVPWTVRNLPVGKVSEQGIRFQEQRIEKMRLISGITDVTRGELPDARVSEVTVVKTQNQALSRIRLKDRQNQYFSLKLLAELVASDLIQHEQSETVLDIEEVDGEFREVIFNPLELSDLEYDIEISSDNMAGVDKDAYNVFLTSLLNTGKISFKQYTQVLDIPRIEKLREFAEENDEISAQAEQLNSQIQQLQMENIKLKATINPGLLSKEELALFQESQREEQLQAIGEPNEGQSLA